MSKLIAIRRISQIVMVVLTLFLAGNFTDADTQTRPDIRLVLQVTIDGLRADLINRYEKGFGQGGFRFLLEKGIVFTNAHYQHANTETIVGHATLATGTFPSRHGMVGNVWFDREAGELAYNIEDPDHPIIATRENETQGEQVDPAQKKSRTQGRSPAVMLAPTFSDALTDDDGIALAVATSRLSFKQTNPLVARVRNNHHVTRSGDIYIVQEPYWFLFDKGPVKAMHGSPWRYDTHVPIIFTGPGMQPQKVDRRVHPVDVAPTIAALLGMTPPGSAQGSPLEEVFH